MSVLMCLAMYYEGIIGPSDVKCDKVASLERAQVAAHCDKTHNCRITWVGDAMWVHVLMGTVKTPGKKV